MSGELEAAGALATAGLAAGAIEGRGGGQHGDGGCANCGAPLQGAYCHACGQAAHPHRSLLHVFEEFLHGILHFDTKAWRTLPMLAFRPGTLTRNYVYGKRARYISPLALFLFTVFFMFAVFAFTGGGTSDPNNIINVNESSTMGRAQAALETAREELTEREAELQEAIANPDPNQPAGLEERLARMQVRLAEDEVARREATLQRVEQILAQQSEGEAQAPAAAEGEAVAPDATVTEGADGEAVVTSSLEEDTWQEELAAVARRPDFAIVPGWDWFNKKVARKLQNPDLAIYSIQQAAYKFSFLLIPISLPFIALLFLWKRGVTFYDHVVFALYGLSFASILFVFMQLASRIANSAEVMAIIAQIVLVVALPVHMFFHLKGAYALGWSSALWRTFFLLFFALICMVIFILSIVVVGLVG
jgi:hypothetical protein